MLKSLCAFLVLCAFICAVGCHAEADVDPHGTSNNTMSNDSSYSKKTTEVQRPDGSYQRTETRTNNP